MFEQKVRNLAKKARKFDPYFDMVNSKKLI
jgi:hypothetical protein